MVRGEAAMKPKKQRGNEPSLRDKLSQNFLKAFESDFEANGVEVITQLRLKSPEKYADIASRLIAATEPKAEGFKACENMHEIGFKLLQNAGVSEYDITEAMIQDAIAANDQFIARLQEICEQAQQGSRIQ
jgi:hypothetical protein